jgi:hypothetical protein
LSSSKNQITTISQSPEKRTQEQLPVSTAQSFQQQHHDIHVLKSHKFLSNQSARGDWHKQICLIIAMIFISPSPNHKEDICDIVLSSDSSLLQHPSHLHIQLQSAGHSTNQNLPVTSPFHHTWAGLPFLLKWPIAFSFSASCIIADRIYVHRHTFQFRAPLTITTKISLNVAVRP